MLSDGKWTRICDSSLLTSKLQLRGKMGRKKKKHCPEPFQVRKNSVVGVPNLREGGKGGLTPRETEMQTKTKEEMERRSLTSEYHGVLFRCCKLTNRW